MAFAIPSPFAWDSSFDVKHEHLNEQHKTLFDLINKLDANRSSAEALKELLDFAVLHFKTEEEDFEKHSYADKAAHKVLFLLLN